MSALSESVSAQLDGSGNGQVALSPPSGTQWDLDLAAVSTSTATKIPTCSLYLGSASGPYQLIDQTYLGSGASSGKVRGTPFHHGRYVWAVWAGGDAGAIATLQVYGQQIAGYRGRL